MSSTGNSSGFNIIYGLYSLLHYDIEDVYNFSFRWSNSESKTWDSVKEKVMLCW